MNTARADLIDSLRRYAAAFEREWPPALTLFAGRDPVFPFEAASDRGLAVLLLAASLQRPDGEEAAARLLAFLYARFGEDLFRLNRVPFEALAEAVEASRAYAAADEAERKRAPGILRSACDFLDAAGPLGPWLASAPDWETRVKELAASVYWMGRHSLLKNKARYFLWLAARASRALAALPAADGFAWPAGEGHARFHNDFVRAPGGFSKGSSVDPARRLAFFAELAREAFPGAGWKAFTPLDAYLRRGGPRTFRCREAQGGCVPCPLAARCPAAKHFIPGER